MTSCWSVIDFNSHMIILEASLSWACKIEENVGFEGFDQNQTSLLTLGSNHLEDKKWDYSTACLRRHIPALCWCRNDTAYTLSSDDGWAQVLDIREGHGDDEDREQGHVAQLVQGDEHQDHDDAETIDWDLLSCTKIVSNIDTKETTASAKWKRCQCSLLLLHDHI